MLKALVTGPEWFGDLLPHCQAACELLGVEARTVAVNQGAWFARHDLIQKGFTHVPWIGGKFACRIERLARPYLERVVNTQIRQAIASFSPDILLALLSWRDPLCISGLRGHADFRAVGWLMDDPFADDGSLLHRLDAYDVLYSAEATWAAMAQLWTGKTVEVLPCGVDLETYRPLSHVTERLPVVFVGSSYGRTASGLLRQKLLCPLADMGLAIYGDSGWTQVDKLAHCYRGGPLNSADANQVYNQAAVVVNIHHPQWREGTSMRTFAICGAGAFQLVDWRPGIEKYFAPGVEIETYRTVDELVDKVKIYVSNPTRAAQIGAAGLKRVTEEHTIARRVARIIERCGLPCTSSVLPGNGRATYA